MAQDLTSFTVRIGIRTDLVKAWNAWTTSDEMVNWFLEKCEYLDENDQVIPGNNPAKAGGTYRWNWFLYEFTEHGKILEVEFPNKIVFTFAGECRVEVTFKEIEGHILTVLTQSQIPTDEKSLFDIRIGCHEGWTFYMANLKSYLEGGLDLRNKIPALLGFNN